MVQVPVIIILITCQVSLLACLYCQVILCYSYLSILPHGTRPGPPATLIAGTRGVWGAVKVQTGKAYNTSSYPVTIKKILRGWYKNGLYVTIMAWKSDIKNIMANYVHSAWAIIIPVITLLITRRHAGE